jgi:hypothetical protein
MSDTGEHFQKTSKTLSDSALIVAQVPGNFIFYFFCSADWGSQTESRKDKIDDAILTLMMLSPMVENPAGFVDLAEGLHLGRAREDSAS